MPIVLQIMKYMKKSRHVGQTKAVIGKIDEAIDVMVEIHHGDEGYDLGWISHWITNWKKSNPDPFASHDENLGPNS